MGKKSGKSKSSGAEHQPETQTTTHVCHVCGKPASFCCPKCKALSLAPTYYCGAACQKADWSAHKQLHASVSAVLSAAAVACPDRRFLSYTFTGPLRKFPEGPSRTVPSSIPVPDYAVDGIPHSEDAPGGRATEIKDAESIAGMREACRIGRAVLDAAGRAVRPGVTTDEIDAVVHEECIKRGAYPSPLKYRMFPKSVCTSVNEVVCHGIPDKRPLEEGDIVNVDVTVYYKGFHGDLNETYPVGKIDNESKKLIEAAYFSMMKAIESCRPGMAVSELGNIIEGYVEPMGFVPNKHYCGHGIGHNFHTDPVVCHYAHNKTEGTMMPGMIFTVEPMIQAGKSADEVWPDGWTVVTKDGKRSAQFEHTILITETGAEILTARNEDSYPFWFLKDEQK